MKRTVNLTLRYCLAITPPNSRKGGYILVRRLPENVATGWVETTASNIVHC